MTPDAAGVDGPSTDVDPEGYGRLPVTRSKGVAEIFACTAEPSALIN